MTRKPSKSADRRPVRKSTKTAREEHLRRGLDWYATTRGILEQMEQHLIDLRQVLTRGHHPLCDLWNAEDVQQLEDFVGDAVASLVTMSPPAHCPVRLPSPFGG